MNAKAGELCGVCGHLPTLVGNTHCDGKGLLWLFKSTNGWDLFEADTCSLSRVLYNDYLALHLIFWHTTMFQKALLSFFLTLPTSDNVLHRFRSNAAICSSDTLTEGEDFNLFSTWFIGLLFDIVCRRRNCLYMVLLHLLAVVVQPSCEVRLF